MRGGFAQQTVRTYDQNNGHHQEHQYQRAFRKNQNAEGTELPDNDSRQISAGNASHPAHDHHNKGRHLLNKQFIVELQEKTGAIPWFVNAGVGRFPFGFFFWKMTKYGVKGKVEWYYNLDNGRGSLVRTEGANIRPTLDYERSREGIDDLKYLCRLEKLIAHAKSLGKAGTERQTAETLLKKIADGIADDWTAYTQGGEHFPADGMAIMSPEKTANMSELNAVRRTLAEQIVKLQEVLK